MWLSLELTVRPCKTGHPKRKCHLPNYEFSGANLLLVSGRVSQISPEPGVFGMSHKKNDTKSPKNSPGAIVLALIVLTVSFAWDWGESQVAMGERILPNGRDILIKEPTSASSNKILQGIPPNKGMWKKNIGCPKNIKHILYLSGIPLIKPGVQKTP